MIRPPHLSLALVSIIAPLAFNTVVGAVPPVEGVLGRAEARVIAILKWFHNPFAVAKLPAAESAIAPLVDKVEQDPRIPAEIKAAAKELLGAIFCKSLLDVAEGKRPSAAELGVTVASSLSAMSLRASPEARSVIAHLVEAHLNRVLLNNPPHSAERVRIEDNCERAERSAFFEH